MKKLEINLKFEDIRKMSTNEFKEIVKKNVDTCTKISDKQKKI